MGANVGVTRANDFTYQANDYGHAADNLVSSRTDPNDAERDTGNYGSAGRGPDIDGSEAAVTGGMIVIATLGTRLTTPAILSAVRPCSSPPGGGEKLRPGKITVTWAPGDSASRRTRSLAHRVSPRSGQSTNSSGTPRSGGQAARSRSACWLSMTKCTARNVVGRRRLAYRSAAITDESE